MSHLVLRTPQSLILYNFTDVSRKIDESKGMKVRVQGLIYSCVCLAEY